MTDKTIKERELELREREIRLREEEIRLEREREQNRHLEEISRPVGHGRNHRQRGSNNQRSGFDTTSGLIGGAIGLGLGGLFGDD